MKAYSMDLRQRVYSTLEGESIRQTAERFEVSEYFVYSLKKRYREAGTLAPKAHGGGQKRRVDEAGSRYIQQVLAEEPDSTLNELCQRYLGKFAQVVSKSTLDRALKRLGITRKKRPSPDPQRHSERVQAERAAYVERLPTLPVGRLIAIDEMGACVDLCPLYGRSTKGQRAYGTKPTSRGARISTVGVLRIEGLKTALCFEGTLNAEVFLFFLQHFLLPLLRPGGIILLDNAKAHHVEQVREWIEQAGAQGVYLPPYSPDLNPIELVWSKVKHLLRKAQARTKEALYQAITDALQTISPRDARVFFQHVGFCI